MTIQNPQAYLDSIWDWAPLKQCFPIGSGVEPTDIDGHVERNGYFLVLEGKAPNVPLKGGQVKMLRKMEAWNKVIPGLFTMIVLWGSAKQSRIDRLQFWPNEPFIAGWDQLVAYVSAWDETVMERPEAPSVEGAPTLPAGVTWLEYIKQDLSLQTFVDAEIARAGIALDTAQYNANHWKAVADKLGEKLEEQKRARR